MTRVLRLSVVLSLSVATMASAQMAVHVVAGVVKSVAPARVSVATDNGSAMDEFKVTAAAAPSLNFPGDLRADTLPAAGFQKVGDSVLLYYYGFANDSTAVAVRDLGASAYTRAEGTVTAFDKHARTLTVKDDGGKETALVLDPGVVIDTDTGVASGKKFSPHKGDRVRVVYDGESPAKVVLLGEML